MLRITAESRVAYRTHRMGAGCYETISGTLQRIHVAGYYRNVSAPAVQPGHHLALWKTLLTAEMNVCYWGWISDSRSKWDTRIKFLIAATASGTVASWTLWSQFPQAWQALSAISALAAIAHPIFFSSEKLKRISGLVATWKELRTNYELLWEKDQSLASAQCWTQYEAAKRREASIDETDLPKNPKLIEKAYEHVRKARGL